MYLVSTRVDHHEIVALSLDLPMAKSKNQPGPKPNPKQLKALWDAVVKWRDEHEVSCAESLLQVDSVNEELPELAEEVFDIVGYWEE
jgi:hypothetical protein